MRLTRQTASPARALTLAAILGLVPLPALAADPIPPRHQEQLDQLRDQIQELKARVQGMGGKLRESANSRKAADQARMDAERRLAEKSQEVERLRAERDALAEQLAQREAETEQLERERESAIQAQAQAETRLTELLDRLPSAEGGSLTPATARAAATNAFNALRETQRRLRTSAETGAEDAVTTAENELHRRQLKLANAISAQGVYRVRSKDTLAQISKRFYGNSAQWQQVFEANRHLLDNPNRLDPGITLVIP